MVPGEVWLVGAGPGDPELLTLRGYQLLRQADVIVHDRLGCEELLQAVSEKTRLIDVGKAPGAATVPQSRINEILEEEAREGNRVLRLKGGDPFVFGRGMEEALHLRERGIACHVVPGISSSLAAPAAAGIPVTHRAVARGFAVGTGRAEEGHVPNVVGADTRIFLMGLGALEEIVAQLLAEGVQGTTPAAIVTNATTYRQQVVRGTRKMLGLLPSGKGPRGTTEQVSLFWSLRCDQAERWKRDFSGWKAEVLGMEPAAAPILDQIHHPEQMLFARYRDVWMSRWNTEDVVYLGDAAHAMSPQLGQGANLALVDAWVLSECLAAAPLAKALDLYTSKRRFNLLYYQVATRYLTPFFQSDMEPVGWFRDMAMPIAAKIPWVRRQMIASMAGVKNGLLTMMPLEKGRLLSGPS